MRKLCFTFLVGACLVGAPSGALAKMLFTLPVAPGGPGQGPWIVAHWPDNDCKDCEQNPRDKAAMLKVRAAILSGHFAGVDLSRATIHLLPKHPFGANTPTANPKELHDLLKGCAIGSQGMLKRGPSTGPGTSYGTGFDCPGETDRHWLSISLVKGRVTHIYYLPGDPIWALSDD